MPSKKTFKLSGRKKGFNIVEVMVSIAIFSLTIVMLTGSFVGFYKNYTNAKKMQIDIENAQYAMNTMAKTLRTSEISSKTDNRYPVYLEAYDYSQAKCIKYYYDNRSIQYQEKDEPTGLPGGFENDGCSYDDDPLSLISNVEKAQVKWMDGRVTVALGIKSGKSTVPIQMSVSLRNATIGSSGSSGGGGDHACYDFDPTIFPNSKECPETGQDMTLNKYFTLVESCDSDQINKCQATCLSDFTFISGACIPICTGDLPENAEVFSGSNLDVEKNTLYTYSLTDTSDKCEYRCKDNYTWDETSKKCNTKTQPYTCTGKPDNSSWFTATSITQTWNGIVFAPDGAAKYCDVSSTTECCYACNSGYSWDENAKKCLLPFSATCNGNNPTIVDGYAICKFTSNGTFTVPANTKEGSVEVLIVGGGGSGAAVSSGGEAGGGGAGAVIPITKNDVGSGTYAITVGAGGASVNTSGNDGLSGSQSSAFEYTAKGGGPGSTSYVGTSGLGPEDGYCSSGGGGGGKCEDLYFGCMNSECSGAGGNPGGLGSSGRGGGGGGAGGPGSDGASCDGGIGIEWPLGSSVYYGGGGGGAGCPGGGGKGGGGAGTGVSGTANTGGGGGGKSGLFSRSGAGGSGIVIIRYRTP